MKTTVILTKFPMIPCGPGIMGFFERKAHGVYEKCYAFHKGYELLNQLRHSPGTLKKCARFLWSLNIAPMSQH
jgi:hypothetical protein